MSLEDLIRVLTQRMKNARHAAGVESSDDPFGQLIDAQTAMMTAQLQSAILMRNWTIEHRVEQQHVLAELRRIVSVPSAPCLDNNDARLKTVNVAAIGGVLAALAIGALAGWLVGRHLEPAKTNIVDISELTRTCAARLLAREEAHCYLAIAPSRSGNGGTTHE